LGKYIPTTQKGTASGVATLDSTGKLTSTQLPPMSYDPAGSAQTVQNNLNSHTADKNNPHGVTAAQAGAVPTGRKVNGKALSADITLSAADVGAAASSHTHGAGDITSGTLPVSRGGTGAGTFTSGAALIGAGTGAITTRAITNNTSTASALTASTNLVTMNTLRNAMNRTTGIGSGDTNYTTSMVRGIKASTTDLTAGSSSLTSGCIYLVYE